VATRLGATRSLQHRATVASPGELVIHENLGKSVNTYQARAHTTTQDALSRGIYLLMLRIFGIAVDDEDARALVATPRAAARTPSQPPHESPPDSTAAAGSSRSIPSTGTPYSARSKARPTGSPSSADGSPTTTPSATASTKPGAARTQTGRHASTRRWGTTALPLRRRQPAARPGRSILLPGRGKLRNSSVASARVNVSN
jgi:hypothetical protein